MGLFEIPVRVVSRIDLQKMDGSRTTRLMDNDGIQARIAEIMAVGAERAEVTAEEVIRELKKLGFSCIGKAVTWRNEVVTQQLEEGEEGEPKTVLVPRVFKPSRRGRKKLSAVEPKSCKTSSRGWATGRVKLA
jgi:hypothetical protein